MHRIDIQTQSPALIGSQNQMPTQVITTAPTVSGVEKADGGRVLARRVAGQKAVKRANINAASSATSASTWNTRKPGCRMISTPMNPTPIAAHRRQPTFSPSTGPDRAATEQGVACEDGMGFDKAKKDEGQHHHADLECQQRATRDLHQRLLRCPPRPASPPALRAAMAINEGGEEPVTDHHHHQHVVFARQNGG